MNTPHSRRTARGGRDAGITLVEVLVAMTILAVISAVGISLLHASNMSTKRMTERNFLWNEMNNATTALVRDISDGSRIRVAEPSRLVLDVVRDGKCQTRDWVATETDLTVTTTFFGGARCTGGSEASDPKPGIGQLLKTPAPFTYFSVLSGANEMTAPVDPLQVGRVGWTLSTQPSDTASLLTLESGAAFTPKGSSTDGTGQVQDAKAPYLEVTTNAAGVEGIDKPVLSWTDLTPELTSGWAIFRIANPEGTTEGDPGRTTWTQLTYIPTATPAPAAMTYTDVSLPAGFTAQYVVRAVIPSGNGPESNQVVTGLRPAAPASVAVDGSGTELTVAWAASVGATGYDVYRSEGGPTQSAVGTLQLHRQWSSIEDATTVGPTLSWTEDVGLGRSHNYVVVATNRWEHVATDPTRKSQTREVAEDTIETAKVNGTALKHERLRSPRDGDFTSPLTPTFALSLFSTTSATDYGTNVAWTPAAWSGGGPLVADGRSRDIWWNALRGSTVVWTQSTTTPRKDTGTTADSTYGYQVISCNDSGCSPRSAVRQLLQRPAVPTCSAGVSGLTTRQATVTSGTSSSATSWQIQKISGPSSPAMGGIVAANAARAVVYPELGHSAAHTWQARSSNVAPAGVAGGGTSAWGGACAATTTPLRVWLSDGSSTTRSVSARLHNEGGNNANLTVEGFQTQGSNGGGQAHTFDPLGHATTYTLTARLSDGYNNVAYQDTIGTQRLAAPGVSFGAVTTRSVQAYVSCANGNSCTVGRDSGGGYGSGTTFDRLSDGVSHVFYGRNSDGYNVVNTTAWRSTPALTVGAPACSVSGGGQAPGGTATISAWGGAGADWYEYSPAQARSGLGAGYYSGSARSGRSDGYNNAYSGWAGCGGVTVTEPVPSAPAGLRYFFDGSTTRIRFDPVPGATSYFVQEQGYNKDISQWVSLGSETVTGTSLGSNYSAGYLYSAGRVRVQAISPGGTSIWTGWAQLGST